MISDRRIACAAIDNSTQSVSHRNALLSRKRPLPNPPCGLGIPHTEEKPSVISTFEAFTVRCLPEIPSTLALARHRNTVGYYTKGKYAYKVFIHIRNIDTNRIYLLGIFEKGPPIACSRSRWWSYVTWPSGCSHHFNAGDTSWQRMQVR